jgi:hypothetical protein
MADAKLFGHTYFSLLWHIFLDVPYCGHLFPKSEPARSQLIFGQQLSPAWNKIHPKMKYLSETVRPYSRFQLEDPSYPENKHIAQGEP